jgi:hypothetical protein
VTLREPPDKAVEEDGLPYMGLLKVEVMENG